MYYGEAVNNPIFNFLTNDPGDTCYPFLKSFPRIIPSL